MLNHFKWQTFFAMVLFSVSVSIFVLGCVNEDLDNTSELSSQEGRLIYVADEQHPNALDVSKPGHLMRVSSEKLDGGRNNSVARREWWNGIAMSRSVFGTTIECGRLNSRFDFAYGNSFSISGGALATADHVLWCDRYDAGGDPQRLSKRIENNSARFVSVNLINDRVKESVSSSNGIVVRSNVVYPDKKPTMLWLAMNRAFSMGLIHEFDVNDFVDIRGRLTVLASNIDAQYPWKSPGLSNKMDFATFDIKPVEGLSKLEIPHYVLVDYIPYSRQFDFRKEVFYEDQSLTHEFNPTTQTMDAVGLALVPKYEMNLNRRLWSAHVNEDPRYYLGNNVYANTSYGLTLGNDTSQLCSNDDLSETNLVTHGGVFLPVTPRPPINEIDRTCKIGYDDSTASDLSRSATPYDGCFYAAFDTLVGSSGAPVFVRPYKELEKYEVNGVVDNYHLPKYDLLGGVPSTTKQNYAPGIFDGDKNAVTVTKTYSHPESILIGVISGVGSVGANTNGWGWDESWFGQANLPTPPNTCGKTAQEGPDFWETNTTVDGGYTDVANDAVSYQGAGVIDDMLISPFGVWSDMIDTPEPRQSLMAKYSEHMYVTNVNHNSIRSKVQEPVVHKMQSKDSGPGTVRGTAGKAQPNTYIKNYRCSEQFTSDYNEVGVSDENKTPSMAVGISGAVLGAVTPPYGDVYEGVTGPNNIKGIGTFGFWCKPWNTNPFYNENEWANVRFHGDWKKADSINASPSIKADWSSSKAHINISRMAQNTHFEFHKKNSNGGSLAYDIRPTPMVMCPNEHVMTGLGILVESDVFGDATLVGVVDIHCEKLTDLKSESGTPGNVPVKVPLSFRTRAQAIGTLPDKFTNDEFTQWIGDPNRPATGDVSKVDLSCQNGEVLTGFGVSKFTDADKDNHTPSGLINIRCNSVAADF